MLEYDYHMERTYTMLLCLLTALGVGGATILGTAFGFPCRKISHRFSDIVLAFAAGVMLAAAIWGLIIPAHSAHRRFRGDRAGPRRHGAHLQAGEPQGGEGRGRSEPGRYDLREVHGLRREGPRQLQPQGRPEGNGKQVILKGGRFPGSGPLFCRSAKDNTALGSPMGELAARKG